MAAHSTTAGAGVPRLLSRRRLDPAPLVTLVAIVVLWQVASLFASAQVIPSVSSVIGKLGDIVTSGSSLKAYAITMARILAGLLAAFAFGSVIGLATGANPRIARYLLPAVRFVQGIPSLSWVVLAVIWFKPVELRIWFIMMMVTLPGFTLQLHDSYRAIPRELRDMARSFRPTRLLMFREVTLPAVAPGMFTAWKVNLGLGIRVVLIAELVGATTGIGVQLLNSQQLFDMTGVVAWTLLLALSALVIQALIEIVENRALRYRPQAEQRERSAPPARVPVVAT
jgi:NitT/TauT family transport system permease protein